MTPEIHEHMARMRIIVDILGDVLQITEAIPLAEMEDKMQPWADGTMSVIAAQSMGAQDLRTSERNLSHAIEVSRAIRHLKGLLVKGADLNAGAL